MVGVTAVAVADTGVDIIRANNKYSDCVSISLINNLMLLKSYPKKKKCLATT